MPAGLESLDAMVADRNAPYAAIWGLSVSTALRRRRRM